MPVKPTAVESGLAAKIASAREPRKLRDLQVPKGSLLDKDITASVRAHLPDLPFDGPGSHLATLTTRAPFVDGIASLNFEAVQYYSTDSGSGAVIGSFYSDGVSQYETPKALINLATAPTGTGNLVTCRLFAGSVGPNYPGFYHVTGPGVSVTFTDSGGIDTVSFVVPAGGTPPITVTINTDRDRIAAWVFFDCTITQL